MNLKIILTCLILVVSVACKDAEQKPESVSETAPDAGAAEQLLVLAEEKPPQVMSDSATSELNQEPVAASDVLQEIPIGSVALGQDQQFAEFKDKFLDANWKLNPTRAVYVGYYKYDNQLLIPNGELRALRRQFYVTELQALKEFDANKLNSSNATDLAIIEAQLKSNIWYIDNFREYEWNPASYNPAGAFGVILNTDYKPLEERVQTISERLEKVPSYYSAAIENIKTPTMEHLNLALSQSSGVLNMFSSSIPNRLGDANLSDEARNQIDQRLAKAQLATESYISFLKAKKIELTTTGEARGFRIGAELYEKKFQHDINSSYTATELYDLAIVAKDKLHREMVDITKGLWPKYFAEEPMPKDDLVAVKQMIDRLSEKHVSRDEFVDEIRRQMPIIQKFMDDNELLDSDPTRPLIVRLMPEHQRGYAGASVNAPGPYDATANTYYNVSPLDGMSEEQAESYLREYNHWILQILNIHEAIPGHYTQLMHANKTPSKIKSIFGNGAMIEGWAVYSERMMLESGYGDNEPEMWLMYSKWNLRVVVNTILDYSVQVLGMQRAAGLDMLMNEAFQEQAEAEGKWRRAAVSQVQLTSYFAGYSEIYDFREALKVAMGDEFNLREFHNKFLSYGNAPVPVIKALMLTEQAITLDEN